MDKKKRYLTTTQMIIISFFVTVFIGGVLLSLPFASASGRATPFIDALFTATTSVCVTGLVVVTTATHWSLLGKIIILILIQIGGLGVITITTTLMVAVGKKISLSSRILLGDAFNLETLKGLVRFLRRVFRGTFIVEGIGALCYVPVFVPEYGMIRGIWYSVFHAISAFCNAGIDIVGDSSFVPYVHNIWVNVVTMALIIFGGIGFIVWWDVLHVIREKLAGANRGMFNMLALHSKIALTMTVFLILSGTLLFALFEWSNPLTIGDFTPGQKLLAACFQSVTTRTAGIATISQKGLTVPSVITSMFLMFIGGSSVGTAGGVKVTTVAVVALSVAATVRGNNDVTCYGRRISNQIVRKSIAIIFFLYCII